jgi:hypothetical protein
MATVFTLALLAGCGHPKAHGTVDGTFSLPGMTAADVQRGGLNFSTGAHGKGHGHTVPVAADGSYAVSLPPGSYSVIGALSGHPGGPPPETCAETISVVVTAKTTTRADFVCHATPASGAKP